MFDSAQEIPLRIITADGDKEVTVTYPSDEQLIERVSKMKTIVRSIGRGKTITEPQANEANDAELFAKLKVSGADLDEFEASQVLGRLTRAKVVNSSREGNTFIISLTVPGAKTTHTLKIPSAKQVQVYTRAVVSVIEGRHGISEMKLNIRNSADLYDNLMVATSGYVGSAPVNHKSDVISEVISLLNQDQDDSEVEGF